MLTHPCFVQEIYTIEHLLAIPASNLYATLRDCGLKAMPANLILAWVNGHREVIKVLCFFFVFLVLFFQSRI